MTERVFTMEKKLSVILLVNNHSEKELSIPISSLNNQIGIDFSKIELLVIDNGMYKLQNLSLFDLFENIKANYVATNQAIHWQEALQLGVNLAQGEYTLFLAPNSQINGVGSLQSYLATIERNPGADVVSAMSLSQLATRNLATEYSIGQNPLTLSGRAYRRQFLLENQLALTEEFGEFSEEYFNRLVNYFADDDVELSEIAYATFLNRTSSTPMFGLLPEQLTAGWLKMMDGFLKRVLVEDQHAYFVAFSRFVIQFYSRSRELSESQREELTQTMCMTIGKNVLAWPYAQSFIAQTMTNDHSPEAPWMKNRVGFNEYLLTIDHYLDAFGLKIKM